MPHNNCLTYLSRMVTVLILMVSLSGCISTRAYVDPVLPVVGRNDMVMPDEPQPVQIVLEFRTKGTLNAQATAQVEPRVIAIATESGLFTAVSEQTSPGSNGGLLTLVIDNIPLTDNVGAKAFGTGLTFGLVGSTVTDGYMCTAAYQRGGKSTEVTVKHALHGTVGNHSGPPGLMPMTLQDGANQVFDQITWNVLKLLSEKKAFDL